MVVRRVLPFALAPVLLAACPGASSGDENGTIVVGVQAEEIASLLQTVHVVAKVDGVVTKDETVPAAGALPKEVVLEGRGGAKVEVTVEGLSGPAGPPIVIRRANAFLVPDAKKLLRMQLQARCTFFEPSSSTAGGVAVPPRPTCDAPQTCASGVCVSADVPFDELEDYVPTWPSSAPDYCRPARHGAPEVVLGQGQTDYATLDEGETVQLEKGPQGGHHVWVAVRMRNLKQSGSRVSLTAKVVDDPSVTILPAGYVFSFDRDEGGFCKLWGLRFQLDSGASDLGQAYKRFLGKRVAITAEVIDPLGERATATKTVLIDTKLLCADGTTTTCNVP